ncbi:CRP-like cAMP-activated global transcriptional regulator [Anaerolineae bacterium]|nr:Crp/Fnr family transcriptional regulator [Anaerolinea sp.]CAG0974386.1 CRP-like cAMP-activated global transcriptional regulator [Anaerolineae bacterium]
MMVSREQLLEIPFLQALSPRTQRCLAEKALELSLEPHLDLYQQGDPPTGLYILQSGRVKLYRHSKDKCQILALLVPGQCLGAESLPTDTPSPYAATTLSPVEALFLPPEHLRVLLDELPDFQELFLRLITDKLKQFITLVHDLAFRDVTSRLAMVLLARAETEGKPYEGGIGIERLLSQQEYADMVGTAREVVYRTFRKFESEGLVHITRTLILLRDLDRLRQIALHEAR